LAIALGYDPSETCSLRLVRDYLTLVNSRIERLRIARFVFRIRDLLWLRRPSSSILGMKYLEVDPIVNDVVQVRPREICRQSIARSLTVLFDTVLVEGPRSTKPKA
jgi:hypothetical protein